MQTWKKTIFLNNQGLSRNTLTSKKTRKSTSQNVSHTKQSPLNSQNCQEIAKNAFEKLHNCKKIHNFNKIALNLAGILIEIQNKLHECWSYTYSPTLFQVRPYELDVVAPLVVDPLFTISPNRQNFPICNQPLHTALSLGP